MKKITNPTIRCILLMATAAVLLFYFSSCARKISFQTSSVVPAAEGKVKLTKDDNNNYKIKITISNLAEPERLQPAKKTYVVWMQTADNGTKNIGQINSSTGFLSDKLKAAFETVTAFKPVKIFITAEDDASIQYPGMQVVLSTNNF
ncbi:MAG: hypothetical protein H7211_09460 [Aquabacterium sp.]|nr:hypothetical protein [Ferruginibacter sp.]